MLAWGGIAAGVNGRAACLIACVVVFVSCDEKKEMIVTETRSATTRDRNPKLFATSDERFRDTKPSPVKGETPDGWLALPATQMRVLNYRFGDSGQGEVWVSISTGSVLDNANRWLKQFGKPPLDQAGFAKLRSVPLAGTQGVWVETEGEYAGMQGTPAKPGSALAGVIASINGRIVTVKMVGPKAEVETSKTILETFAAKLKMVD